MRASCLPAAPRACRLVAAGGRPCPGLLPCQAHRLRPCGAPPSGSGGVEPPDVRQLANMAQLDVTDEQVAEWSPKIAEIVGWFGQLQSIDLTDVPPATRAELDGADDGSRLRPDVAEVYGAREALLEAVPEREGVFVKVPAAGVSTD